MNTDIRILSPCGMLGYGFPEQSFMNGLEFGLHGIVVDAGSTDGGPHKLGAGVSIVSKRAVKKDLDIMITQGLPRNIPIIIGSAGGSGARTHVNWTLDIIDEILDERGLQAKVSVIWADFTQEEIHLASEEGRIKGLSPNIPPLTRERIDSTNSIVAQMGHEPIVEALKQGETSSYAAGLMIRPHSRRSGSIMARTRGYPIIWEKYWNAAHCAPNLAQPRTAFLARSAMIRLPFNRLTRTGRAARPALPPIPSMRRNIRISCMVPDSRLIWRIADSRKWKKASFA